jgi:hypothetical protein
MSTTETIIKIDVLPVYSTTGSTTIPSGYLIIKTKK